MVICHSGTLQNNRHGDKMQKPLSAVSHAVKTNNVVITVLFMFFVFCKWMNTTFIIQLLASLGMLLSVNDAELDMIARREKIGKFFFGSGNSLVANTKAGSARPRLSYGVGNHETLGYFSCHFETVEAVVLRNWLHYFQLGNSGEWGGGLYLVCGDILAG